MPQSSDVFTTNMYIKYPTLDKYYLDVEGYIDIFYWYDDANGDYTWAIWADSCDRRR